MNRILSWKIDNGIYAYIYIPNSSTHISSRISEDSPMWSDVLSVISQWDENTYKTNFEAMAKEIQQRYGVTLEYKDEYYNFVDGNAIGDTSVVLLAGDDGRGGTLVAGSGGNTGNAQDVYDQFLAAIEAKLAAARAEILSQNNAVREYVEDRVTNTISEAQKMISDTKEELDATRGELTSQLEDAKDAIDKASSLFEMRDKNITADDIKNALSSVSEYGGWMEEYSGSLADMKVDYDAADGIIGGIGTGEDADKGLFSKFATSVNTLRGTVRNVETTLNAAIVTIKQVANWYDTYSDEATKAAQYISASGGFIANSVEYINGSGLTSTVDQQIDAKMGRLVAENADIQGTIRANSGYFKGTISAQTGYIGETLLSNGSLISQKTGDDGQPMYSIDGSTGKISAKDVQYSGEYMGFRTPSAIIKDDYNIINIDHTLILCMDKFGGSTAKITLPSRASTPINQEFLILYRSDKWSGGKTELVCPDGKYIYESVNSEKPIDSLELTLGGRYYIKYMKNEDDENYWWVI